jgi:hypothetical protein
MVSTIYFRHSTLPARVTLVMLVCDIVDALPALRSVSNVVDNYVVLFASQASNEVKTYMMRHYLSGKIGQTIYVDDNYNWWEAIQYALSIKSQYYLLLSPEMRARGFVSGNGEEYLPVQVKRYIGNEVSLLNVRLVVSEKYLGSMFEELELTTKYPPSPFHIDESEVIAHPHLSVTEVYENSRSEIICYDTIQRTHEGLNTYNLRFHALMLVRSRAGSDKSRDLVLNLINALSDDTEIGFLAQCYKLYLLEPIEVLREASRLYKLSKRIKPLRIAGEILVNKGYSVGNWLMKFAQSNQEGKGNLLLELNEPRNQSLAQATPAPYF